MHRSVPLLSALTACMLLTACAGPETTLDAGVKQVGVDVFFGTPTPTPVLPSLPSVPAPLFANPYPDFPAPLHGAPQLTQRTPVPNTPAVTCPTPGPLDHPSADAPVTGPVKPPTPGVYPFRFTGTLTVNPGPSQTVTHLPTAGTREVTGVTAPDSNGSYAFSVVEKWNGVTTTTTYTVVPNGYGGSISNQGNPTAGMYLTAMTDSKGAAFTPAAPGVLLMAYPAQESNSFQGAGTDALHQVAMEIDPQGGNSLGDAYVNACGHNVDSVKIQDVGRIVYLASGQEKDFTLTFNAATQFGGLPIADHLVMSGISAETGQPFSYDVTATINVVPKAPA